MIVIFAGDYSIRHIQRVDMLDIFSWGLNIGLFISGTEYMRLAFISLGSQLIQYFSELRPYLQARGIEPFYFTLNPKVRDQMRVMGVAYEPASVGKHADPLTPEQIAAIMNPVLELRYRDKRKLHEQISQYYALLQDFMTASRIDAVFVWNGSGRAARVAAFIARQRGLPVLFGENGYLPDTIQIDPEGVNQLASVSRRIGNAIDHVRIEADQLAALRQRIEILHSGRPWAVHKPRVKASLGARLASELRNISWDKLRRALGGNRNIPVTASLPSRYIFIPFQVEADSQLILHSPLVGTDMELFLEVCYAAVQQAAPDCKLVVKLHPANLGRINYAPLLNKFADVQFLKGGSISRLIEGSQAVITINSTVGLEALTYYKPVLTLGDNFYNVPGIVYHAETEDDLPGMVRDALDTPVDRDRIDRMLYYLYTDYFGHGSWRNHTIASYQAVSDKIAELLTDNQARQVS